MVAISGSFLFTATATFATFFRVADAYLSFTHQRADDESFLTTSLHVPHGCQSQDNSPTRAITVTLDSAVLIAGPGYVPGWNITTTTETLNPPVMAGKHNVSSRIATIKWEGGPLPHGQFLDFPMRIFFETLSDQTKNKTLYFPVLQECTTGNDLWNQIPTASDYNAALRRDAPQIVINVEPETTPWAENDPSTAVYADSASSGATSLTQNSVASLLLAGVAAYYLI